MVKHNTIQPLSADINFIQVSTGNAAVSQRMFSLSSGSGYELDAWGQGEHTTFPTFCNFNAQCEMKGVAC